MVNHYPYFLIVYLEPFEKKNVCPARCPLSRVPLGILRLLNWRREKEPSADKLVLYISLQTDKLISFFSPLIEMCPSAQQLPEVLSLTECRKDEVIIKNYDGLTFLTVQFFES